MLPLQSRRLESVRRRRKWHDSSRCFAAPNTSKVLRTVLVAWRAFCAFQVRPRPRVSLCSIMHTSHGCRVAADSARTIHLLIHVRPGLLGEDDGATDLGTLERKLAEKKQESRQASQATQSNPTSPLQTTPAHEGAISTPQSSITSPEPSRDKEEKQKLTDASRLEHEEEVEALSEMMCSLVTNTSGETRYLGMSTLTYLPLLELWSANQLLQALLRAFRYSPLRASNGLMKRLVTSRSSK